ncbi:MAG: ABC transporter substrate-binding protein [Hyphomicrobiales bacterium]|nr:ABC transporter substrate-binding protein [Hyphomicrobiales bacterium]
MQGDLRSLDPIWTTANISSYHGALIYDTLFGVDANDKPQPQMVESFGTSDDQLTWTFKLRDGLGFHDGSPVTAADCVASIRRWAVRDGAGQHMFLRVKDIGAKDDKTFAITFSEPYPLILDAFAKAGTPVLYIMRKKDAETDPMQQITEHVGSGPFIFNTNETKQGAFYVYDRNAKYRPRSEPASGMAGGKIAKLDRVIWENVADDQTAIAALQNGEIDFYELPPIDLIDQLEADKNIHVEVLNKSGQIVWCRMNWLYPPFNNVKARQAMLYLVNQNDVMKAAFGNPKYYRACASYFGCGTPMENDENTEWFKEAPNKEKAAQLFKESGYDGRPIVILQPTNFAVFNTADQLLAQWLREIGVNAELAASDWGGVVTRRANREPPEKGGWNIFVTSASGAAFGNPITLVGHQANGEKGWFGWPSDETHEKLRDKWAKAQPQDRLAVAKEIQRNAWNFVPHVYMGLYLQPAAMRANVKGVIGMPELIPFWNIEKT